MRSARSDGDDDDRRPQIEVVGVAADSGSTADSLEYGREPHPRLRALAAVAATVAIAASLTSTLVSHRRAAEQRRERASYDQLLSLSAAGEASVEQAVSRSRDVSQYAEPLLNSQYTAPAVRTTLYRQVRTAQQQGLTAIEAQRELLAADPVPAGLKAARAATLAYLTGWSAMFTPGGGSDDAPGDLIARQQSARTALEAAAPDAVRAARAVAVLGTSSM